MFVSFPIHRRIFSSRIVKFRQTSHRGYTAKFRELPGTPCQRRWISTSNNDGGNLHPPAASKSDPRLLSVLFSLSCCPCSGKQFCSFLFSSPRFLTSLPLRLAYDDKITTHISAIISFSLETFIAQFMLSLFLQGAHFSHFVPKMDVLFVSRAK